MPFLRNSLVKLGLVADPSLDKSRELAKKLLSTVRDQDTARLRQLLPWPLKVLLSDKRGNGVWSRIKSIVGSPRSFTRPELHQDGLFRTMKTLFTFERARFGITVSFLRESLVGIRMHAPISIGLVPAWTPPSYVDETCFDTQEITLRGAMWLNVRGTLTMPKHKGRKSAVLMLPGSGPGGRDQEIGANKPFRDLALGLTSSGIVTLRMDKPVVAILLKTFVTKTVTLYDEFVLNGLAALKYLFSHPEVDPSQVFVLGFSLGGGVAPRLCAASPFPIAGMISLAGNSKGIVESMLSQMAYYQEHFPRPKDEYEKERQPLEEIQQLLLRGCAKASGKSPVHKLPIAIPMSYLKDDFDHDPVEIAKTLPMDMPKLFVQGKDDWQVTVDHFEKWKEAFSSVPGKQRTTFRMYDGIGHCLIKFKNQEKGLLQYDEPGHVDGEIIRGVVQWIQQVT